MFKLNALARKAGDKLIDIRKEGRIPAVFYGFKKETTSITVDMNAFKKVWREAGESSQVTLETPDGEVATLIHDLQTDPVSGAPIHVDFLAIDTNKAVTVNVPIEFEGISDAVKDGLGTLAKVMYEIEISALPKDLPQELRVDLSVLKTLDDQIHAKDVVLPSGVTLVTSPDEVVALVTPMQEEKEEAPIDLSAIEVEKKGKKEEEEGAEGAE